VRTHRSNRLRSNLVRVGRQLLAHQDFDQLPVSTITSAARCSVGAFYARFPHKTVFIDEVIVTTFDMASRDANRDLAASRWRDATNDKVVHAIAEHVVTALNDEAAGVMRAALKRAQGAPAALGAILSYRSVVTNLAVDLLTDRLPRERGQKKTIRIAMQVLHATVTDSVIHDRGPLQPGTRTMIDELGYLVARHLEL
jgi:AcrR family transcriptional regulator